MAWRQPEISMIRIVTKALIVLFAVVCLGF